jgi:hypothetical protein
MRTVCRSFGAAAIAVLFLGAGPVACQQEEGALEKADRAKD